jgi:hypothetical protein
MDPEAAATNSNVPIAISSHVPITLGAGGVGAAPEPGSDAIVLPDEVRSGP